MFRTVALSTVAAATLGATVATATADPLVVGTNYQEYSLVECIGSSCKLLFTPVPVGKTLVITGVDCTFSLPAGAKPYGWQLLARKPVTAGIRRTSLTFAATTVGSSQYMIGKTDARHIVVGGDKPEIAGIVFQAGNGKYTPNCTLVGVLQ